MVSLTKFYFYDLILMCVQKFILTFFTLPTAKLAERMNTASPQN